MIADSSYGGEWNGDETPEIPSEGLAMEDSSSWVCGGPLVVASCLLVLWLEWKSQIKNAYKKWTLRITNQLSWTDRVGRCTLNIALFALVLSVYVSAGVLFAAD